jgi:hypothetical protein
MATKTIGTAGRDFSTEAAWIVYLEALTFSGDEVGDMYADSEFTTTAATVFSTAIDNTGVQKVILRAAPGQGFGDHASKTTNALRYNASNGVGIRLTSGSSNHITIQIPRVELVGLQIKKDSHYSVIIDYATATNHGQLIDRCIVQGLGDIGIRWKGNGEISSSLLLYNGTTSAVNALLLANDTVTVRNSTIARSASAGSSIGVLRTYSTATLKNTAVFGFNTNFSGTISGNNNAADSAIGFGSSNQASLTYGSQFEAISSGSEDYRFKVDLSGSLDGNGANADKAALDIIGQTRGNPPAIGAWDVAAAAAAALRRPVMVV